VDPPTQTPNRAADGRLAAACRLAADRIPAQTGIGRTFYCGRYADWRPGKTRVSMPLAHMTTGGQWGSGRSRRQRDSRRSCRSVLSWLVHGEQNRGAGDGRSLMERLTRRVLLLGPTSAFEVCCGRSQRDRLGSSPLRRWAGRGPAATRPRQRWPSPCRVRPRPSRQVAIGGWPAPSAASVMVESCPV